MKKIDNWSEVSEQQGFKELKASIQVLKIIAVEDFGDKEYIKIKFDIKEGELKGYFKEASDRLGSWPYAGSDIRSYKTNALPYFKAFITAVEKSNDGYKWNWDEQSLVGKTVVGVFGDEEYLALDSSVGVSTRLQEWRSLVALKEGKIKVPVLKKLKIYEASTSTVSDNDEFYETSKQLAAEEDLPF